MRKDYIIAQGGRHRAVKAKAYRIRCIGGLDSLAFEQEPNGLHAFALALAECRHELFKLRRALDLEKDLVVVVGDLDVQVLSGSLRPVCAGASTVIFARHLAICFLSIFL